MKWLRRLLIKQFSHPAGLPGEVAGWIMSRRESNLTRNRWTVEMMGLQPADRVLEIGPGPGVTLQHLLSEVTDGQVVALDHSSTMLGQCRRRNRLAVEQGRLILVEADYQEMPDLAGPFNHIIAVNSLQFTGINDSVLKGLHNRLKPAGRLAITYQPRGKEPTNEAAVEFAGQTRERLKCAGFSKVSIETLEMQPVNVVCLLADK